MIGDEAQNLKNRRTRNAKSLASLSSRGRFLLTGTPVENSLYDLLSLTAFLMPGALHPIPSSSRGDERTWHEKRFLAQAAPYVLRRSKKIVAPELPDKIEQVVYVDMTPEQAKTYASAKAGAEKEIVAMEEAGVHERYLQGEDKHHESGCHAECDRVTQAVQLLSKFTCLLGPDSYPAVKHVEQHTQENQQAGIVQAQHEVLLAQCLCRQANRTETTQRIPQGQQGRENRETGGFDFHWTVAIGWIINNLDTLQCKPAGGVNTDVDSFFVPRVVIAG